jgi:hypothetical protein
MTVALPFDDPWRLGPFDRLRVNGGGSAAFPHHPPFSLSPNQSFSPNPPFSLSPHPPFSLSPHPPFSLSLSKAGPRLTGPFDRLRANGKRLFRLSLSKPWSDGA